MNTPAAMTEASAEEARYARQEAIIAAMREMARRHVAFAKDGGDSRGACWDNLADTVAENGNAAAWSPLWGYLEAAFSDAWPEE